MQWRVFGRIRRAANGEQFRIGRLVVRGLQCRLVGFAHCFVYGNFRRAAFRRRAGASAQSCREAHCRDYRDDAPKGNAGPRRFNLKVLHGFPFSFQQRKSDGNEAYEEALHQKLMKSHQCAEKHWARVADAPKPAEPYDFQRTWRRARRPRVRRKSLGCVSGDRRLKEGERDEGRRI